MADFSLVEKFKQIWSLILARPLITLVTHTSPDGDTYGSAVALKHLILANTANKRVLISGHQLPRFLTFLDERDEVSDADFANSLVIVIDVSARHRFADQRVVTEKSIKIDHHLTVHDWMLEIGGDHWPATGELIFEFALALNLKIPQRALDAIFVAIWTDTDGMTQRQPTARTHQIVDSLQVDKPKLIALLQPNTQEQRLMQELLALVKVKNNVTCLITDKVIPNDYGRLLNAELVNAAQTEAIFCACNTEEGNVRVSLRSKSTLNVEPLAREFGGGGHFNSSGIRVATMDEAMQILQRLIDEVNNA